MDDDMLIAAIDRELRADSRVLAAWLAGSRGRGEHDAYSDVDVWLVTADADRDGFVADWPATCDRITPTVLRERVFGGPVFTHVTPEWLRFDVAVGVPGDVPGRSRRGLAPLFDRAGLAERLRTAGEPLAPDPARVAALGTEFLRVLGLLPVVVGRGEYVVGVSGAGLLHGLLVRLMREDVAVEDRGGALRLAGLLPPDRLARLADLPPLAATRESVVAAHLAYARLFLPLGRELADRTGAAWPGEMEAACRRRLADTLGVDPQSLR
ncbi:MAG TPA: nucleotidyltransferase domain-containing protein [Actinocatenispora sp.]